MEHRFLPTFVGGEQLSVRFNTSLTTTSRSKRVTCLTRLFLVLLLWVPLFASAQNNGDIITISINNHYLSLTADNSVTDNSTPTRSSLWRVETDGTNYAFRNVETNFYLNGSSSSLSTSSTKVSPWEKDGSLFFISNWIGFDYYINFFSNSWTVKRNNSTTRANATTRSVTGILSYTGASPLTYPYSGGTQTVTLASVPSVTVGSVVIPVYSYALQGSSVASFTVTPNTDYTTLSINASPNSTAVPRQANLVLTYGESQQIIILSQAAPNVSDFVHQQGHSGRPLLSNGMQGVHTERITRYIAPGVNATLEVPESSFNYSRWYDYRTDGASTKLVTNSQYSMVLNGKGVYKTTGDVIAPTYRHSSTLASGVIDEIACDLSYYSDFTIISSYLQKEPTLSQRVIFEIHPAREMATMLSAKPNGDGLATGLYLEEYEMTAPVGRNILIGPKYEYIGSGSNYFTSATSRVNAGTWYRTTEGGTKTTVNNPTINNNRVLVVTAPTTAQTITYTLIGGSCGIAKFTIHFKNASEVGPSATTLVSESDFSSRYQYVTGLRFDGTDRNIPLEWDETGYGFFYSDKLTSRSSHSANYWSEYQLMNITSDEYSFLVQNVRDMKYQNTGATDGNFLYVDASTKPGVVANLKFKDGGLCPGSRMYVSAWINNVHQNLSNTRPNLNFSIVGIDAAGVETEISTFTTGDIINSGVWNQILFELQMPEIDYVDYRLRVVNNAVNASGNDFALDNICVYMQKPALMTYQAGVTCSNNNEDKVIMVRINPAGLTAIPAEGGLQTIYYQFQKSDGASLGFKEYLNPDATLTHGYAQIDAHNPYTYYEERDGLTGLQRYLNDKNNGVAVPQAFTTREQNDKGVYEDILYIFHISNSEFIEGNQYRCVIAAEPSVFGITGNCGFVSEFMVEPRAKLIVNDQTQQGLNLVGLCADQYNTISLQIYGAGSLLTQLLPGSCKADWLEGREEDYAVGGAYAEYDFTAIKMAIEHFRMVNPNALDLQSAVVNAPFTNEQKSLLADLIARGYLELNKSAINRRTMEGYSYYVAFPIPGTGRDKDGKVIEVCSDPISIWLQATATEASFNVGDKDEKGVPAEVYASSRVLRMSADQANSSMVEIKIKELVGSLMTIDKLNNAEVYLLSTTTDKTNTLPFDNGTVENNLYSDVQATTQPDGQIVLSLSNRLSSMQFKPGHCYDFMVMIPLGLDGCNGTGRFSIITVPDMVMWSPKDSSHSWNVDRNWDMIDNLGTVLTTGNGYVPMSTTNVLLTENNTVVCLQEPLPATSSRTAVTLQDASQSNIEWDMNYQPNTCHNIHIGAHAMLVGQQYLQYDSAWVDYAMKTNGWNLVAPPFYEMVCGDMYIPSTGDQTPLFTKVASPDSRRLYEVFPSFFNSVAFERVGDSLVSLQSVAWTEPFNALSYPIDPTKGYSIDIYDRQYNTDEVVIRLPKEDTRYYYYNGSQVVANLYADVPRSPKGYRLVGTEDATHDNVVTFDAAYLADQSLNKHLMANPYLAELDMMKFYTDEINIRSLTGRYSTISSDSARTRTIYNLAGAVTNKGRLIADSLYIKPNTSFMVELEGSNPQLHITPEMQRDYLATETTSPISPALAPSEPNSLLVIKGKRNGVETSCTVMQKASANSGLDENDTQLMMFSSRLTPSNVFTNVENTAVVINMVSDIHMTALGYSVLDTAATRELELTFTGVDEFDGELSLYDAQKQQYITLSEGTTLSLPEIVTSASRYYICYKPNEVIDGCTDTNSKGVVKIYQPTNGNIVVACSEMMQRISVFAANGQLLAQRTHLNSSLEEFMLPCGIYVVEVITVSGVKREKCVVR